MPAPSTSPVINGMSIDVEDYYQVQALSSVYGRSDWETCESRVERNTDRILQIFDGAGIRGTFFTLGWIAERHPNLIRRIVAGGHELACHGYCHARVDSQQPEEFRADVRKSKRILEDIGGAQVRGYRAATFSVGAHTPWAWPVLEEEGYAYSSSVYPVKRDFYGMPDAPRGPYRPEGASDLLEIPISTARLGGRNWPVGGGGYFRFLPYLLSRAGIARVNKADRAPAVFYLHPWEVDPGQPRVAGLPFKSRFRHYVNLSRTEARLKKLARDFLWDRMDRAFGLERARTPDTAATQAAQ